MSTFAIEGLAQALFEEAGDALVLFDPDTNQVLEVNPATLRLTGFTREELLRLPATSLFQHESPSPTQRLPRTSPQMEAFHSQEGCRLRTSDDRVWVPVHLTISRLRVRPRPLALLTARDTRA